MGTSEETQRKSSKLTAWEEIILTEREEQRCRATARREHLSDLKACIEDARKVIIEEKMMDMQSHVLNIALALFEKRTDHVEKYKEEQCKRKPQKRRGKRKSGEG